MTPLRKKMIRAMELNNLSRHTQRSYLADVNGRVIAPATFAAAVSSCL